MTKDAIEVIIGILLLSLLVLIFCIFSIRTCQKELKRIIKLCKANKYDKVNKDDPKFYKKTLFNTIIIIILTIVTSLFGCFYVRYISQQNTNTIPTSTLVSSDDSAKSSILFSEDELFWCYKDDSSFYFYEDMIKNSLLYYEYTNHLEKMDYAKLEEYYNLRTLDYNNNLYVDITKTFNYIDKAISIGLLNEAKSDLKSIDEDIRSFSDPRKVPIELYKQELVLRIDCFKKSDTFDNAYQTARAADDIVEKIKISGASSYEEFIFFSAIATDFYLTALSLTDDNEKEAYIYRRLGILYIALVQKFESKSVYPEVQEYIPHFLLYAGAFFNNYSLYHENLLVNGIADSFQDIDYYKALILYKQITYFQQGNKCELCGEFAMNYLESFKENERGREAYYDTCFDIMLIITERYSLELEDDLVRRWNDFIENTN